MISLILGFLSGLFVYGGLNAGASNNPWLFAFAIIFMFIIAVYLLWKIWEAYNKNKANRIEVKIKKEQLEQSKKNNDKKD